MTEVDQPIELGKNLKLLLDVEIPSNYEGNSEEKKPKYEISFNEFWQDFENYWTMKNDLAFTDLLCAEDRRD